MTLQPAHTAEQYKEIGIETLRRMSTVDNYNRWLHKKIAGFVGQRVFEVGGGIGNMTELFLDRELNFTIDVVPDALEHLAERYAQQPNVQWMAGDILNDEIVRQCRAHRFDTALCINVLEHIEHDEAALQHMNEILMPGGRLILFVPAGRYLYGTLDQALGHFRRYEIKGLRSLIERTDYTIERLEYCNVLGIPGWWLNSRVLKRNILPTGQLKLFNWLAPLFLGMEGLASRLVRLPIGQSLLCVARKR